MKLRIYAPDSELMVYQKDFNKWIDGNMMHVEFISEDDQGAVFEEADFVTQLVWIENEDEEFSMDNPPLYSTEPDVTLLQYTGLKDELGRDIYEGDVVVYTDGYDGFAAVVEQDYWQWYLKGIDPIDNFDFADYTDGNQADLKVIGNIFENPELLERSK